MFATSKVLRVCGFLPCAYCLAYDCFNVDCFLQLVIAAVCSVTRDCFSCVAKSVQLRWAFFFGILHDLYASICLADNHNNRYSASQLLALLDVTGMLPCFCSFHVLCVHNERYSYCTMLFMRHDFYIFLCSKTQKPFILFVVSIFFSYFFACCCFFYCRCKKSQAICLS